MNPQDNGHNGKHDGCLPFFQLGNSPMLRGAANAAMTQLDQTALINAIATLYRDCLEELKTRVSTASIDLDPLEPQLLAQTILNRIQALPELLDAQSDQLQERSALLRELASAKPTRLLRLIQERAQEIVEMELRPIREALIHITGVAPYAASEQVPQLQERLSNLHFPEPDYRTLTRFQNLVRVLHTFAEQTTILPSKALQRVKTALAKRALVTYDEALATIAQEHANQALRYALESLAPLLEELVAFTAQLRQSTDEVQQKLERARTEAHHQSVNSRVSVLLQLPADDAPSLIAGMKECHKCADRRELSQLLNEKLETRLNELASTRYSLIETPAQLGTLLSRVKPEDIAHTFSEVIRAAVGDAHTVYTAIHHYGVGRAVTELFQRAAVLCHLSRDHEVFNILPEDDVLVRFPQPVGPADAQIKEDLQHAFSKLAHCMFEDADPAERDLTVVRTKVGFPAGALQSNFGLLTAYAACKHTDHPPHLLGIIPESPDGRAIPAYVSLAEELRKKGPHK